MHATNVCVKVINVFNKISPKFDPGEVWFNTLNDQVVLLLSYPVHCSVLSLYKSTFPSSPAEWVVSHTAHYQILYRCISPAQKIICHINERINLSGHALFFPLNQITCVYPRLFSVIISSLMVSLLNQTKTKIALCMLIKWLFGGEMYRLSCPRITALYDFVVFFLWLGLLLTICYLLGLFPVEQVFSKLKFYAAFKTEENIWELK